MAERIKITLAEDNSSATIEFLPASGASGSFTVSAEQLLSLIQSLGDIRARMVAGKPIPELEGQEFEGLFNTRWYIAPEPLSEGSAIAFYHIAFGPVAFIIPIEQVAEMVRLLSTHLEMKASQTPRMPS